MKRSKNAQYGVSDKLLCSCGAEIQVVNLFTNGKMRTLARCPKCHKEARRPSELF